ncbi:MAG: ABC transporter substrate-binding protein [Candidatus Nanopelagicales bacterium]
MLRSSAVLLSLVLGVAACSGNPATAPSEVAGTPNSDTVTLVTYDSYAISKKTLADFTEQTGLTVKVSRGGDAAEVVNRALLTAGTPEGDVLFGVDNNLLSRATAGGLFTPYEAAGLASVPKKYRLDPENDVTPIDVGDVCVNYDKEWFAARNSPCRRHSTIWPTRGTAICWWCRTPRPPPPGWHSCSPRCRSSVRRVPGLLAEAEGQRGRGREQLGLRL